MTFIRRFVLASVLILGLGTLQAHAQRTDGAFGLGAQLGDPTGFTAKIYNDAAPSYDLLMAWDVSESDFFFLNVHALFEQPFTLENVNQPLEWFIGPGAYIGSRENPNESDAVLGISGSAGINWIPDPRVEVFVQLTPRINVIPETTGDIGGGVGVRYYF
ncbi:hypothetical protein [Salisaeta longa]|uniref:hypothetical protein n=1 Tax=Salisaeta longa TaxID=503170 RepID=UPI0003B35CE7|nr:hypothetical protein [Salisaeta longa]